MVAAVLLLAIVGLGRGGRYGCDEVATSLVMVTAPGLLGVSPEGDPVLKALFAIKLLGSRRRGYGGRRAGVGPAAWGSGCRRAPSFVMRTTEALLPLRPARLPRSKTMHAVKGLGGRGQAAAGMALAAPLLLVPVPCLSPVGVVLLAVVPLGRRAGGRVRLSRDRGATCARNCRARLCPRGGASGAGGRGRRRGCRRASDHVLLTAPRRVLLRPRRGRKACRAVVGLCRPGDGRRGRHRGGGRRDRGRAGAAPLLAAPGLLLLRPACRPRVEVLVAIVVLQRRGGGRFCPRALCSVAG
mmetsp:Transcript_63117/g.184567  ORF Transcript_63117/g.184567 Transcript_63117/m.184567 type:complete len:298 (+) Transcript_63117:723-1616(+)